jgi:hypothetical protein
MQFLGGKISLYHFIMKNGLGWTCHLKIGPAFKLPNHLKTELQNVWYSNVSCIQMLGDQMFGVQMFTVYSRDLKIGNPNPKPFNFQTYFWQKIKKGCSIQISIVILNG